MQTSDSKDLDVLVVDATESMMALGAARLGARVSVLSHFAHESNVDAKVALLAGEGVHVFDDRTAPPEIVSLAKVLLLSMEAPLPTIAIALNLAREHGAVALFDGLPGDGLPDELISKIDLARPLEAIASTRQEAFAIASNLLKRDIGAALVEVKGQGHLLIQKDGQELWLPYVGSATAIQKGFHEAMFAAFATGLAEGHDLSRAALFANAAFGLSAGSGSVLAGLPLRDEVMELLNKRPRRDLEGDTAA